MAQRFFWLIPLAVSLWCVVSTTNHTEDDEPYLDIKVETIILNKTESENLTFSFSELENTLTSLTSDLDYTTTQETDTDTYDTVNKTTFISGMESTTTPEETNKTSAPTTSSVPTTHNTTLPSESYVTNYTFLKPPVENKTAMQEMKTMTSLPMYNVTSFEEPLEHNAALPTVEINSVTEEASEFVVGRRCTRIFQDSIFWNDTDGGMLALKSCPPGYQGSMYRPCFSSGKWGNVDYSECRLEHLGRMRHMIFHQAQKGMLGNMYLLADEFSKYLSSVDIKSPLDRLEAFEILNMFLKLNMNLKMDKARDIKYVQALLRSCNELITKKTVLFSPGSQKNKLITEKAVETVFDLTHFAEGALRGLLKTQKKELAFRSLPSVVLYLYRGELNRHFTFSNFSSDYAREEETASMITLEKTLQRSAYALIWIRGLSELLSSEPYIVNSDIAVATILSPLNSLNHLLRTPTFDIGLRMKKEVPDGYSLKCGQLWNVSQLWNTEDCFVGNIKGDIVTCRCHHLARFALLLEQKTQQDVSMSPTPRIGKMITVSCVASLTAIALTLGVNFLLNRRDQPLSSFILINLLICMAAIQIIFVFGINKTSRFEICFGFALALHYLFLVSCFWVVSYSMYLLQRLRSKATYNGRIRDYWAFSWIVPFIVLVVSFIGNPDGYETKQYCWLTVQRGILWSFVIPVTGLILINTVVMILVLKTFNEQMSVTHRTEICKTRTSMRAGITLLPFFAINWFFGILAVEDPFNIGLQIAFSLTNTLQGILTFVFFCIMDNNVQLSLRLKFSEVSKKPKISAMKMKKSGSFPILERPSLLMSEDSRRMDCTPLLASRMSCTESSEDPCCSNIRV